MKIGLVGRVNVGKSTIFNRLLGTYRAIVTDIAGTTREIISEEFFFDDKKYAILMDSPGLENFNEELKYIEKIITESDILIFVVDGKVSLTPMDQDIQKLILKHGKKNRTVLAVNKLDDKTDEIRAATYLADFYVLGFEDVIPVSAKIGQGIDDIFESLQKMIKKNKLVWEPKKDEKESWVKIAIVGRPNVGKSTLINKFFGDEVSFVSEQAGTTLDYITCEITYQNQKIKLYDTAGIRKKGKIHGLEKIAHEKTIKMLQYVKPIIILMIDMQEGVTHRDLSLLGELIELHLPIVVAFNKTDEVPANVFERAFQQGAANFDFARRIPLLPISAQKGIGLPKLLDFILKIHSQLNNRVSTGPLNKALNDAWIKSPPRFPKNKVCKFYYSSQIYSMPPKFLFFINKEDNLNFAFKKWLENVIRKNFGFVGIPIEFEFKEKDKDMGEFKNNDERHKLAD